MRVEELMSRDVITVSPETPLKQVAEVLVKRGIAGVPVCDARGKVLGIVSEADILWKELGVRPNGTGLIARVLESAYGLGKRTGARTAGDAMSSPALTVKPESSVTWAAVVMTRFKVNRLPVLEHDTLVGIITRADLVRAFSRPDEEIESEIRQDVLLRTFSVDPESVSLIVKYGMVVITGEVENRSTAELIDEHIRRVPGVVSVHSELDSTIDDRVGRVAVVGAQLRGHE
jgi:CBS domain-containing protein